MKLEKHKVIDHFYFPGDHASIDLGDGTKLIVDTASCIEVIVKSVRVLNNE